MTLNLALLVFVAGGMGSVLRWLFGFWSQWPSLAVNVLGSLLIGAAYGWAISRESSPHLFTHVVMAGFLGGFTTFSAFSLELLNYIRSDAHFKAIQYGIFSVALSLLAVAIGFYSIKILSR